jgi:hypothetical protein
MSRKVEVEVKFRVTIIMDDDEDAPEVGEVLGCISMVSDHDAADIENQTVLDYNVVDSK